MSTKNLHHGRTGKEVNKKVSETNKNEPSEKSGRLKGISVLFGKER